MLQEPIWHMHKSEYVLENETCILLCKIQMDHPISCTRQNLESINKKKRICQLADFPIKVDHKEKMKEGKNLDQNTEKSPEKLKIFVISWTSLKAPVAIGVKIYKDTLTKQIPQVEHIFS